MSEPRIPFKAPPPQVGGTQQVSKGPHKPKLITRLRKLAKNAHNRVSVQLNYQYEEFDNVGSDGHLVEFNDEDWKFLEACDPATVLRLIEVAAVVPELIDQDECSYDHHGYCQAHAWFHTEPSCPQARAKAALRNL